MIIKEAQYKTCGECPKRERVAEAEYGCDQCGRSLQYGAEHSVLEATVFQLDEQSYLLHFCSWLCALKKLPEVQTDYFISLPFLFYDQQDTGKGAEAFFAAIKQIGKE